VPDSFFERNEGSWRGRVQPSVAKKAYSAVQDAARKLCLAIKEDFIADSESNKADISYIVIDNLLVLKKKPIRKLNDELYFNPKDRNGKQLKNRWTTKNVQEALSNYIDACEQATEEVSSILSNLADTLQEEGHIPALIQSTHMNLILSAAFHHAVKANKGNWQLAKTIENSAHGQGGDNVARFVDIFPYWMHRSKAVSNTFDLSSMILLTAPNMSGKSTLMRSTAAAALLTVCGLCAPLSSQSRIPRFDTLFLRGASADVPTEDKSAFGAEMGDLSSLFRCCGPNSLVFVDELARGTSPHDGTRLAGAVLEAMAERGMSGFFATHLHDIVDLPLRRRDLIVCKRMAILHDKNDDQYDADSYEWTYRLEDGVCTDSLALVTAERFGLPEEIIQRADELEKYLPARQEKMITNLLEETSYNQHDETKLEFTISGSTRLEREYNIKQRVEKEFRFKEAVDIASGLTGASPVNIPPRWLPPPSWSNKSCLYLLELAKDPPIYYVGETDSLSQRLQEHRKKGGPWKQSRAVAFPANDKTQARYWESLLIQKLAKSGYRLESTQDGRSNRTFRD
jgi:DNA mismatch repair ATPase MutS